MSAIRGVTLIDGFYLFRSKAYSTTIAERRSSGSQEKASLSPEVTAMGCAWKKDVIFHLSG